MADARATLLAEIESYLQATGMAASRLGQVAMGDPSFVLKIRQGRNVRIDTADRIREYIRDHPPTPKRGKRAEHPKRAAPAAA